MTTFEQGYQAWKNSKNQKSAASSEFEKGYQAWKSSKGMQGTALSVQSNQGGFDLSAFEQDYLKWQLQTGRITQEQALKQLNKPYDDFIDRVNDVLSGYDQFVNNYNTRFDGRKYDMTDAYVGDSRQYLDEATAYNQKLISETDEILAILEKNPDAFDKDTVGRIKQQLYQARVNTASVLKVAEQDNEYWSVWGDDGDNSNQGDFNFLDVMDLVSPFRDDAPEYNRGEKLYQQAQKELKFQEKHAGKTGLELVQLLNFIKDEDEKEWVTGEALRTLGFVEAEKYLEQMEADYLEAVDRSGSKKALESDIALDKEQMAATKASAKQFDKILEKYGVTSLEGLADLITWTKGTIAESQKVQEYVRLSLVKENDDFEKYVKIGRDEAEEYSEQSKKTAHMTLSEIKVLAYYIGKDKENGTNTAETYKDAIKHFLKHRRAEEFAENTNNRDIPVIEGALRIGHGITSRLMDWGMEALQNFTGTKIDPTVYQMAYGYILNDPSLNWVDRLLYQAAGTIGYMAPSILASKLVGGTTGIKSLGKAAGSAMLYLGSAGSAYGEALEKGHDKPVARVYSTLVGLSEVTLQNAIGGISELGGLPAKLEGFTNKFKNALLKGVVKYGISGVGETIEEELQSVLEPTFRSAILGEKFDMPTWQEAIDTALVTLLTTGALEGPGITSKSIKEARLQKLTGDQITQHSFLTNRERVVVNTITQKLVAEAEQSGKKLSGKEKQAIYDQVVEDMNTGRIDIKDIENSIGKGEKYEQLVSEFEELKKLNSMNPMEMTGDQLNRRDELREKNIKVGEKYGHYGYRGYEEAIKRYDAAFSQAVEGLVKSDRLSESYRERDRRSEAYKVEDLSVYSEKQRQTIQAAMDSGILNNTRRTHEFVELIAKLSEKMGVKFNFTDNQRLKESGFAIDGVTVNGYVNQDGITINVNSAKALNRVVGHEITHILEGTDLYDSLAMAVAAYAKTKGEYESRLQQIRELYKGKEGYTGEEGANTRFQAELNAEAKFEKELIADLVGDYLFTDKQFVEKLFNEDRGLFNWIRKQIDYIHSLCKAGSKEARQLEKSKKMFTEVFNEAKKKGVKNPTAEGGVKYSLGDVNYPRKTIDYKDTNARRIAEDETVNALISRGKVTTITKDSIPAEISNVNWGDKGESRKAIKEILKDFLGEDVVFNLGEDSAIAYLTSKGIDHTLAGENTEEKAVALSAFYKLISNAEYSYSGLQDQHSKTVGREEWDYFVSVAEIEGGATVPLVFAVRSIDQDVRSQIYSIATKKNLAIPRGDGTQGNPANAHPSYGDSSSSNGIVEHNDKNVNNKNSTSTPGTTSLSLPGQVEAAGGGWNVRGQDVGLPMPEGYQESPVAVAESQQAQPVNLPGLEKSQPQSQGKAQSGVLPMPKQTPKDQQTAAREALHEALFGKQQTGTRPAQQTTRQEVEDLDAEYRRQMGDDSSYYDPEEGEEIETGRGRLERKKEILEIQMRENQSKKEKAINDYDQRIAETKKNFFDRIERQNQELQEKKKNLENQIKDNKALKRTAEDELNRAIKAKQKQFDAKKNKKSKTAQALRRGVENLRRKKYDVLVEYDQAILKIESQIEKLNEKIEANISSKNNASEILAGRIDYINQIKEKRIAEYDSTISNIQRKLDVTTEKIKDLDEKGYQKELNKEERLQLAYQRIEKARDAAELEIIQKYNEQKAEVGKGLENKEQWIKNKAFDVLWEMGEWVKGEKPSQTLGRIWDIRVDGQRIEWNDIKHALADIKDGTRVQKSYAEDAIMEVLERTYQDRVDELTALDEKFNQDVEDLKKKAEQAKEEARRSEDRILRSDLHAKLVGSVKQAFTDEDMDFDTILGNAKDLSTLKTVGNTPQRVMEKALGYKAGQVLSDMTFNKVAQNETDGIRWLNAYTDRKNGILKKLSDKYHIKPGSKESAAAQMYAEGFYVVKTGKDGEFVKGKSEIFSYGDAELARDFPDVNVQKNIKGLANDPTIRQIYDATLDLINASRVRNAYPEIQKLDNYFLHFRAMEDFFSKLGLPFNPNDIRAKDLPTDLNGVTADLKPGQPYFASAQHREGKRTSFDLLGGLEMYLTSAKNQIFHIDDIQMLRALRNYVADIYGRANGLNDLDSMTEEEQEAKIKDVYRSHLSTFAKFLNESANVLAGKTALIDRGVEGFIGRRGLTLLNDVNKQVGAQAVGYNISSPMTNFLSVVQAVAKTEGFKMDFLRAAGRMAINKITRQDDGFAEKCSVIVRRKGADQFNRTLWQKIGDPGYWFMGKTDEISTELIARTKYNELIRKGMDEQTALYETDKWVSRLMGDRSLGQMPLIFNSKTLGLFTKFQLEVRNQLDSMYYDTIQEAKALPADVQNRNARIAAKVTSKFAQLAILQHVFGMGFQKVAGYNPAFDIISIIATAFGWNDDDDSEDTFQDNFEQALAELLEDLPYTSALTGGRIPIGNALPIVEFTNREDQYGNEKPRWQTALEVLPYFVMPGGYGQAKKTVQGLNMYGAFDWLTGKDHSVPGNYTSDGRLRYPTDGGVLPFVRDAVFGKWSGQNAQQYIDEGRSPLSEKQTEEFFDLGVSIEEYWDIQDGLKQLNKESESGTASINDVGDYIGGLDLTTEQKNILINNYAGRKEPIDMTDYDNYDSFEEFDYATQNPGKYAVSQAVGGFEDFKKYREDLNGLDKDETADYINDLDIDYGMKIILYVFKCSNKASREAYGYDIVEYLNGRDDISVEQIRKILRELGFKVDWEGNVTWD